MTAKTRKALAKQFIDNPKDYPEYEVYVKEFPELNPQPVEEEKSKKKVK